MALAVASAVCTVVALAPVAATITMLSVSLMVASVFNQPVSSAIGGLVAAVMPEPVRGHTGGWSQAGILGGGIIAAGSAIWLTDHASTFVVALVAGALISCPAFVVLGVREPPIDRTKRLEHLRRMIAETKALLRRRDVWLAFIFFLSPIGAGALMNLFSAVGDEFHVSSGMVIIAVTIAGLLTPFGAIIGGILSDRYDRRIVYAAGGFLAAASVSVMVLAPMRPATYFIGAATYALATGFAYATFMALAYALLGKGSASSGTQFTLFMASVNVPVVYMLRLDGLAHARFGIRGMLLCDGAANLVFAVVLLGVSLRLRVAAT
jgi:MFS family permease